MQPFSNEEIAELKSRVDQIHQLLASRGEESSPAAARCSSGASGSAGTAAVADVIGVHSRGVPEAVATHRLRQWAS